MRSGVGVVLAHLLLALALVGALLALPFTLVAALVKTIAREAEDSD